MLDSFLIKIYDLFPLYSSKDVSPTKIILNEVVELSKMDITAIDNNFFLSL